MTTRRRLRLHILPGTFAICRLDPDAAVPPSISAGGVVSVTRTPAELSIVCEQDAVPEGVRCETGWKCLAVEGPLAFSETGVLASVAGPLADAGVSIFAMSTFDTDYVLVHGSQLPRATGVLDAAGHQVAQ
jgi:uncharacterized protein